MVHVSVLHTNKQSYINVILCNAVPWTNFVNHCTGQDPAKL